MTHEPPQDRQATDADRGLSISISGKRSAHAPAWRGWALVLVLSLTCTGCAAIVGQLSWQLQEKQAEARESLERDTQHN